MTVLVVLTKRQYHLVGKLTRWCEERIGPYQWSSSPKGPNWEEVSVNWTLHQMFGNSTFAFRDVDTALQCEKQLKILESEDVSYDLC